jgi:L-aminopeptidase/D-esterase-like protein
VVSESHIRGQLLKSSASSTIRILKEREEVAGRLADAETAKRLREVVKPNSISRTLRKAGVALILAPDPITAVPGAMMLGASFATRGRQPLSPASVFEETQKLLDEMGSIL